MWPRALTAAKRKEVAYHQDTVYAVQSDKLQLWSTVLLASIYLAETSKMLSALHMVWKALGLSLGSLLGMLLKPENQAGQVRLMA